MDRSRVNIAVGMFVILGIVALAYLSIQLGQVSFLGGRGYAVTVDFPSVGGLKAGSAVESDDQQLLGRASFVYDALYTHFQHSSDR